MGKQSVIIVNGVVSEKLPNTMFRVILDNSGVEILCTLSGKMRMYNIKILPGDSVKVEMSPYDMTRGRISQRLK